MISNHKIDYKIFTNRNDDIVLVLLKRGSYGLTQQLVVLRLLDNSHARALIALQRLFPSHAP